jgi:TonB family protein
MRRRRESRIPDHRWIPANERFKRSWTRRVAAGVVLAAVAHFVLFAWFPELRADSLRNGAEEIALIELPPEVTVPPPPSKIARPARPVPSDVPLDPSATIPPTTFEAHPPGLAPPPARSGAEGPPRYIAREVNPALLNGAELARLLQEQYPPMLEEAGIGGRVVLWVFVDATGAPVRAEIRTSSGYPALDRVALEVVPRMRFAPAMNRDRPVGVWTAQPVDFRVRR